MSALIAGVFAIVGSGAAALRAAGLVAAGDLAVRAAWGWGSPVACGVGRALCG